MSEKQLGLRLALTIATLLALSSQTVRISGRMTGPSSHSMGQQQTQPGVETNLHLNFPDFTLIDQEGRRVRFYTDLIKGKVVLLSFFYTTCGFVCDVQGRNLAKLQSRLGDLLGTDVYLISVTRDPVTDTPAQLKKWSREHGVKHGWTLVTGDTKDVAKLVARFQSDTIGPVESHSATIYVGNDATGTWRSSSGLAPPEKLIALINEVLQKPSKSKSGNDEFPRWSHDGKKIVFTSDRDGDPEIYVMNADGSNPVRLTRAPGRDAHPYFSRDGRKILFQSPRANGVDTNVYVMNSDGSNVIQLTRLKGFAGVPSYSPDETRIVFQARERSSSSDNPKWRICTINVDGRDLRVITSGEANDQVPNWSRDGKRLLFFSDRTGKNQIYTMKADGTDVQRISHTESNDQAAFWSPDNRKISFTSDRDGNSEVYVMVSDGRNSRLLTRTRAKVRAAVWSPNGN
jgi:TolB protein